MPDLRKSWECLLLPPPGRRQCLPPHGPFPERQSAPGEGGRDDAPTLERSPARIKGALNSCTPGYVGKSFRRHDLKRPALQFRHVDGNDRPLPSQAIEVDPQLALHPTRDGHVVRASVHHIRFFELSGKQDKGHVALGVQRPRSTSDLTQREVRTIKLGSGGNSLTNMEWGYCRGLSPRKEFFVYLENILSSFFMVQEMPSTMHNPKFAVRDASRCDFGILYIDNLIVFTIDYQGLCLNIVQVYLVTDVLSTFYELRHRVE